jgi:sugar phosphate isomerase/epimerase
MKFAICNEIFQDFSLEQQFETAAEIGFAAIEIAPFTLAASVRGISEAQRERLRVLAERTGLEVVGIHWLLAQTEGFHLTSPDADVRQRTVAYLQDLVRFGVEIGGSLAVVGSPLQRGLLPGVSYGEAWEHFREAMAAAAQVEGAEHFTICLEPLAPSTQNSFLFTAAEALQLAREINLPNVQVILDCYSGVQMEVDFPAALRAVCGCLGHFHLNDHNGRAPGYGETDFVPIMRALHDIHYQGYASIEVFDFSPDPVEQATRGLRTVDEALAAGLAES